MIKQDARLFFSSLFISLLIAGWVTVFFVVDSIGSRYESNNAAPALRLIQTDTLLYTLDFMGHTFPVYLEPFNELDRWRKEYACLVTPRGLLTLEQLYSLSILGRESLSEWYREYQYQQNVLKQPSA